MPPDPESELSSLEEEEPDKEEAAASSSINRWNRVRELAATIVTKSTPSRVRQKISLLNAIAQHVAAASSAPPDTIYKELYDIYKHCAEVLPDRHRPLLASPIKTLQFALRERQVPEWFTTSLEGLLADVAAPNSAVQADPVLSTSLAAADPIGEESLDLDDFSLPKSTRPRHGGFDPISLETKLAYIESCGCAQNIYSLMKDIQSGVVPFSDAASSFLREVAWMESVQSWQDWNPTRGYQLAQLANELQVGPSSNVPTILPPPPVILDESVPPVPARKMRRLDNPSPNLRPFTTAGGVVVVHPVARQNASGVSNISQGGRHAGVSGTMWDHPVIRKSMRLDDVQALFDLRDFCVNAPVFPQNDSNDAPARGAGALPRLEGVSEPCYLTSRFPVHSSVARMDELQCSVCGLVLASRVAKRTHLKTHLVRAYNVLPQLLSRPSERSPPLKRLEPWQQIQAGPLRIHGTKARAATKVIGDLFDTNTPIDEHLAGPLQNLFNSKHQITELLEKIPQTTSLPCHVISAPSLSCVVCNAHLTPVNMDGVWYLQNVLTGQLRGTTFKIFTGMCAGSFDGMVVRRDLESVIAGPAQCGFRKTVGRIYSSARDRTEPYPDGLKGFLSRLVNVLEGDVEKLQTLTQAFSREAQAKMTTPDEDVSLTRESLKAFEYYLDRFSASLAEKSAEQQQLLGEEECMDVAEEASVNSSCQSSSSSPSGFTVALSLADAQVLHSRFGETSQLLVHTSCLAPFMGGDSS